MLFSKKLCEVKISFENKNKAFVEFTCDQKYPKDKIDSQMVKLFAYYYAYCISELSYTNGHSDRILHFNEIFKNFISAEGCNRPNILNSERVLSQDIESHKSLRSDLLEKNNVNYIKVYRSKNDNDYLSVSLVFLLQHLINILDQGSLNFLIITIGGMHDYYEQTQHYSRSLDLAAAPIFGFQTALHNLK